MYILQYLLVHIFRKAVPVEAKYKPISLIFQFQYLCSILMVLEAPIQFIVRWTVVDHKTCGILIQNAIIR